MEIYTRLFLVLAQQMAASCYFKAPRYLQLKLQLVYVIPSMFYLALLKLTSKGLRSNDFAIVSGKALPARVFLEPCSGIAKRDPSLHTGHAATVSAFAAHLHCLAGSCSSCERCHEAALKLVWLATKACFASALHTTLH